MGLAIGTMGAIAAQQNYGYGYRPYYGGPYYYGGGPYYYGGGPYYGRRYYYVLLLEYRLAPLDPLDCGL